MHTWLMLRGVSWPIIELGIIAFAIAAAVRTKTKGLWMLAAASVLGVLSDAARFIMSGEFLYRHPNAMNYLTWVGVALYVAMLLALCGWGVLAFRPKDGQKPRA